VGVVPIRQPGGLLDPRLFFEQVEPSVYLRFVIREFRGEALVQFREVLLDPIRDAGSVLAAAAERCTAALVDGKPIV
jgi:hypothetical protein